MSGGAKRRSLSINEKVKIIELLRSGKSNADICQDFRLPSSTVSSIWAKRNSILEAASSNRNINLKRLRKPARPDVDNALLQWFTAQRSSNIPITGPMLREKAENLANLCATAGGSSTEIISEPSEDSNKKFVCTTGWIDRFKKRYNIKVGKTQGDEKSVDTGVTNFWLKSVLRQHHEDDIFNDDETFPDWLKLQNSADEDNLKLPEWETRNKIDEFAGTDLDNYVEVDQDVIKNDDDDIVEIVNKNSSILEEAMITCDEEIQTPTLPEHEIKTEHIYLSSPGESPASANFDYVYSEKKQLQNIAGEESDRTGEDQFVIFGTYVASEMKNLKSDSLRRKLKRKILQAIIEISKEEEED